MKKAIRTAACLLIFAVLLLSCFISAYADGTVTYDGNAKEFIFLPGSKYSPSDLFTDFKNVMPGDSVTQKVTINNKIEKNVKIKVYMRSLGAGQGSEELLSGLTLTVKQNGNSDLFKAPADQTAQLTDWVYLGTIYSGGKIDLDVTLDVPITLENRFRDAVGYLNWQFRVEELPVSPDDPKPPTGEDFDFLFWLLLIGSGSVTLAVLLIIRRKKETDSLAE